MGRTVKILSINKDAQYCYAQFDCFALLQTIYESLYDFINHNKNTEISMDNNGGIKFVICENYLGQVSYRNDFYSIMICSSGLEKGFDCVPVNLYFK